MIRSSPSTTRVSLASAFMLFFDCAFATLAWKRRSSLPVASAAKRATMSSTSRRAYQMSSVPIPAKSRIASR